MENAEEIYNFLEDFTKRKPKVIPPELNDYLSYVARTGDPVYQWSLVKCLFKEKLLNVITDFYEATPVLEIPPYPNVDPFNYDTMKNSLLERLDSFNSAPFTVQRICELLTYPRKQYNRIDKFMRAIEKNILVVSTREPGVQRLAELDNGDLEPAEPIVNGSDNSEYNVDIEMEDVSWKENTERNHITDPQPSSSDTLISVDDIETRLQAKETASEPQDKCATEYESLTPPELDVASDEADMKTEEEVPHPVTADVEPTKEQTEISELSEISGIQEATDPLGPDTKADDEMKRDVEIKDTQAVIIPEIKVDDAEMTEKRLIDELNDNLDKLRDNLGEQKANIDEQIANIDEQNASIDDNIDNIETSDNACGDTAMEEKMIEDAAEKEVATSESETKEEVQPSISDESSSDSNIKEEPSKMMSEVSTSSEESSSSDNMDGNSNSPKIEEINEVPQEVNEVPQEINEVPQEITEVLQKIDEVQQETNEVPQEITEVQPEINEVPRVITQVPTSEVTPEVLTPEPESMDSTVAAEIIEPSTSDETVEKSIKEVNETPQAEIEKDRPVMESDNYSVADVESVIPQPREANENVPEVGVLVDVEDPVQQQKTEVIECKEE